MYRTTPYAGPTYIMGMPELNAKSNHLPNHLTAPGQNFTALATLPPKTLPDPSDADRAETAWQRILERAARVPDLPEAAHTFYQKAEQKGPGFGVLNAVFGASPYLTQLLMRDLTFGYHVMTGNWTEILDNLIPNLLSETLPTFDRSKIMVDMRVAKRRMALTLGLADVAGQIPVMYVTRYLSKLADACLQLSLDHLIYKAITGGHLTGLSPERLSQDSGLFIIAMGKMGAFELNYSSDIDIIVLFDPNKVDYVGKKSLPELYVRLTKDLSAMMQEHTGDGYVFRVDLRLRPDAGATQPAMSVQAAENYYESQGQNWERAAMIKARICAGDKAAGEDFLAYLKPFIWRKYLDFASIEDIQSLKRQFHQHKGHADFAVSGHNIKLGRGGIREVELFAQTQQLIMGGKNPSLRDFTTLGALDALVDAHLLSPHVREDMADGYRFLRVIEHRLQMLNDEQTQTLPTDEETLERLARFCAFPSKEVFSAALMDVLKTINGHYAALFAHSNSLASSCGNLVFTGTEDDPETLKTLTNLGYNDPPMITKAIRTWHHGRFRATQSARARELLTNLTPFILEKLSETEQPDDTFKRFDTFIRNIPAGVQIFSLISNNPSLFDQLRKILSTAPELASYLAKRPQVLDAILTPGFSDILSDRTQLVQELDLHLRNARFYEDILLDLRRFANDKRFQIGMRWLRNPTEGEETTSEYTLLADVICQKLLPYVQADLAEKHGHIPGGEFALIGMGKMGSREMAPLSDLDMIFIYRTPEGAQESEGAKPLSVTQYYARLSQRFINALTALTPEGTLYEVDMRLRPSGSAGPLATSFERFVDYQHKEAWTWEHMALCRARVVAGTPQLSQDLKAALRGILCQPHDIRKLMVNASEMRDKIRQTHGSTNIWDLKHAHGGIMELEAIVQVLTLAHAHKVPKILRPHTTQALMAVKRRGLIPAAMADDLIETSLLYRNLNGLKRLCLNADHHDPETWPKSLKDVLGEASRTTSFPDLEMRLKNAQQNVVEAFNSLSAPYIKPI